LKITREIKTAILVIASILLFIWGYSFLKGRDLFTSYKEFLVKYDSIEGLNPSAPVVLNGFTIGRVKNIELLPSGKLQVELQIKNDFPITKGSIAQIYAPSPIGDKQIEIIVNATNKIPAETGDFLIGTAKTGMLDSFAGQIDPLKIRLEKILDNVNVLLESINQTLDTNTRKNLKQSLENLNQTMLQFKEASAKANNLLTTNQSKISNTLTNAENASKNFSKLSDTLVKAEIGKTVKSLEKTLANVNKIISGIESGKGTLGKLVKDDAMYTNFTKSSKELELLLQDLRLYPTRYINVSLFGKKNKPYVGPTAKDTIQK
jgi:phospholipid/cholesterol/gamma-HCH transport system substrate-binding protein